MWRITIKSFIIIFALTACGRKALETRIETEPVQVPDSFLSVDIDLPVSHLEYILQEKLPTTLMDEQSAPLGGGKKDSLYLTMIRYEQLSVQKEGSSIVVEVPLYAEVYISKKVMGFRFKNDNNPVKFKCKAKIESQLFLGDNWEFNLDTEWKGVTWVDKPEFSALGVEFDLTPIVENAIQSYSPAIEKIVSEVATRSVDLPGLLSGLNQKLQAPNRIVKQPFSLYLSSETMSLKGNVNSRKQDTLTLHAELASRIRVSDLTASLKKPHRLGGRLDPLNQENAVSAYVELFLGFDELKDNLNAFLKDQPVEYQDYNMMLTVEEIGLVNEALLATVFVKGDINGKVRVSGVPQLDRKLNLSFSSFEYEIIEVDDEVVSTTDASLHRAIERQIGRLLELDLRQFLEDLDKKAMDGLNSGDLVKKVQMDLSFEKVEPYVLVLLPDALQLIMRMDGEGKVTLQKEVLGS